MYNCWRKPCRLLCDEQSEAAIVITGQGCVGGISRIIAYGQAGDDNIQVAAGIRLPAWLYGDAGDD